MIKNITHILSHEEKTFIKKLHLKKHRQATKKFLVAGYKSISELIKNRYKIDTLVTTPKILEKNPKLAEHTSKIRTTSSDILNQISPLTYHEDLLAIIAYKPLKKIYMPQRLLIILDNIQNPQNLGAIMRIADWYKISQIIASPDSVDYYNPKAIQASMGSFVRVEIDYTPLVPYLQKLKAPIIGATLTGQSIHTYSIPPTGALIIGNEGHGIRKSLYPYFTEEVSIPRYGNAQSLNLAVATGILCDNWFRKKS